MAARHVEGSAFERDVRRSASVQRGKGKGNPYVANAASAKGKGNHTWRELRPRATIEKSKGIGGASCQDLLAQPIRRLRPALPIRRLRPIVWPNVQQNVKAPSCVERPAEDEQEESLRKAMSPRGESCDEVFEELYEEYMRSRFVGWRFMNHAQRDALERAVLAEDAAAAERERALAESLRVLRSVAAERERMRWRGIMRVFRCLRASEVSGDASAVETEDEG